MTETIWIAIGIIMSIIVIILLITVYTINISRKQKQNLLAALDNTLAENKLQADRTEIFRNRIVVLDVVRATLIYIRMNEDNSYTTELTALRNMRKCELIKAGNKRVTMGKNGKSTSEEHINEILLSFTEADNEVSSIMFYSEIEDGLAEMLDNRKKAEEWKILIEEVVTINK